MSDAPSLCVIAQVTRMTHLQTTAHAVPGLPMGSLDIGALGDGGLTLTFDSPEAAGRLLRATQQLLDAMHNAGARPAQYEPTVLPVRSDGRPMLRPVGVRDAWAGARP